MVRQTTTQYLSALLIKVIHKKEIILFLVDTKMMYVSKVIYA